MRFGEEYTEAPNNNSKMAMGAASVNESTGKSISTISSAYMIEGSCGFMCCC